MFDPLPPVPDSNALELEVLERWEREGTFQQLRDRNRGGPRWSFIDGPVTANKALAVHTAWGRTLKDVFQRYKALRGFDQRYQNGFDCQGLWIEVGVERQLGLNSKREIEEFGLEEFARRCREVVIRSAEELTRGEKRLGQWMDWGNDYFTFSDTNIEYIWRFLKIVNERGWLYVGHRSTEWCPRCGTSLSQHELTQSGVYQEKSDPSLYVRFPLLERDAESIVIWTTTPWTLPANVAAAVNPEAEYGLRENGEWVAVQRYPDDRFTQRVPGSELVGLHYRGPFDDLAPGASIDHQIVPWDEVSLDEGTGIVHIATGCGGEDFELGRSLGLPVLTPVDEAGHFYDDYGWLHGLSTVEAADQIVGQLAETGFLVEAGVVRAPLSTLLALRHAADLADLRRLVHRRRQGARRLAYGERDRRLGPGVHGQAHGRLAAQHGRLEHLPPPLLRPAAPVLPVLLRPRERDRVEGRAARTRDRRVRAARGAAPAVDRPCPDHVRAMRRARRADRRGRRRLARRRDRPVLDARLAEPDVGRGWLRDGRIARALACRPARPCVLGAVVPRRLGLGDARADPALVLLAALHVGGADRSRAVQARARLREDARRARARDARLVGEHDLGGGGIRAHGRRRDALAVLRAAARPRSPVRLRPRTRDQAQAPDVLELDQRARALRRTSPSGSRRSRISNPVPRSIRRSTAGSSSARMRSCTRRPRVTRRR